MPGELGLAILAEHVFSGSELTAIVDRLGSTDKAALASEAITVETLAMRLRDIAAPRRSDSDPPPVTVRNAPQHHSIINRHPGQCECRRHVPAGAGSAVRIAEKWRVFCRICAREKGYL